MIDRYHANLANAIAPGGNGCHGWILSTANLGTFAGVTPEQMFADIRQAIPRGKRRVADREIHEAIQKATSEHTSGTYKPQPKPAPLVQDSQATLRRLIASGTINNEADLWEASPTRLADEPQYDAPLFLESMFQPDDLLFIGDRLEAGVIGRNIRTQEQWIQFFQDGGQAGLFIIINPLSGQPAPKKSDDGQTLRGDNNVHAFRYCMAEFDNLSREDQIKFWSAVRLPIRALIDTGGKSIHAWLEVSKMAVVETLADWQAHIKGKLYDRGLTPLGVDSACSNPARLSRLPGFFRQEKKNWQRILWLSPEGRFLNNVNTTRNTAS